MSGSKIVIAVLVIGIVIGAIGGYAIANQPHMYAALNHLQDAKIQLEQASPNKGGHRVKAIRFINMAMEEIKKGVEAGDRR